VRFRCSGGLTLPQVGTPAGAAGLGRADARARAVPRSRPPDPGAWPWCSGRVGEGPGAPRWGKHDSSPLGAPQLRGDPHRTEARVREREGHHPLLDQRRGLVGHFRPPAFPGHQDLRPEPEHLGPPPVEREGVDPHSPTRRTDVAELGRQGECSQLNRYRASSWVKAAAPFRSTCWPSARMRRLLRTVRDVHRCRHDLGDRTV
jgi:hypothetical protein